MLFSFVFQRKNTRKRRTTRQRKNQHGGASSHNGRRWRPASTSASTETTSSLSLSLSFFRSFFLSFSFSIRSAAVARSPATVSRNERWPIGRPERMKIKITLDSLVVFHRWLFDSIFFFLFFFFSFFLFFFLISDRFSRFCHHRHFAHRVDFYFRFLVLLAFDEILISSDPPPLPSYLLVVS